MRSQYTNLLKLNRVIKKLLSFLSATFTATGSPVAYQTPLKTCANEPQPSFSFKRTRYFPTRFFLTEDILYNTYIYQFFIYLKADRNKSLKKYHNPYQFLYNFKSQPANKSNQNSIFNQIKYDSFQLSKYFHIFIASQVDQYFDYLLQDIESTFYLLKFLVILFIDQQLLDRARSQQQTKIRNSKSIMIENENGRYPEYEPLKWPPQLSLAQLHLKCSCPGKDNTEGEQCLCCGRYEKLKISNWPSRNILKDFKAYGGGVPAYFSLTLYMIVSFAVLSVTLTAFHIYCVEVVCDYLKYKQSDELNCYTFLFIFKFVTIQEIYMTLMQSISATLGIIFLVLQTLTFVLLIVFTLGMKIMLQRIKQNDIIAQKKAYSKFSLLLKNIPPFYQIDDVRKQVVALDQRIIIKQIFFLHQTAQFEVMYRKLFDMYFEILFYNQKVQKGQDLLINQGKLRNLYQDYQKLYETVEEERSKLQHNQGRAIVVFNCIQSKTVVRKKLKISQIRKFSHYSMKLFGVNTQNLNFYADYIEQPHQILWNYIGESSVQKTKIRIETTIIGIGWMLLCFAILYFPIVKVDEERYEDPLVGNILNVIISFTIQFLAFSYRAILLKLIPRRKPSSKISESHFILFSTVFFHFFFFIVAPGTFYLVAGKIPYSIKLTLLFVTVSLFLLMVVLIGAIDLKYRGFNRKKKKLLFNSDVHKQYCQMRLHEELNHPTFPLDFRLMVIYNIWSFNSFYIFEIPYLMIAFLIVLCLIYLIDKKNLYKHYKMQTFQSIDLEIDFHNSFIILFLFGLCGGYAISSWEVWQWCTAGGAFVLSILANFLISSIYKKQQDKKNQMEKSMTMKDLVQSFAKERPNMNALKSFRQDQLKTNFFGNLDNVSSQSLGSVMFGGSYQDVYDKYLSQFKNKTVNQMLKNKYQFIKGYLRQLYSDQESKYEGKRRKKASSSRQRGSQMLNIDKSQIIAHSLPLNNKDLKMLSLNDKRQGLDMKQQAKSNSIYSQKVGLQDKINYQYQIKMNDNESLFLENQTNRSQQGLKQQKEGSGSNQSPEIDDQK